MSLYVFLNWFSLTLTVMALILVVVRYRFLLLKPSMIVIIFFHVQIQWAATFQAAYIEQYLPSPWSFLLLAQGFPLLGLVVSFFILNRRTASIYSNITKQGIANPDVKVRQLVLMFGAAMAILMIYLTFVPFSSTGIYAILVDPLQAQSARETSLKLLDSALLRYGFSFLKAALAPMLCVLALIYLFKNLKAKNLTRAAVAAGIILFTMAAVSLPGARTPAAMLILTMLFALFAASNMPLNAGYIAGAFIMIIAFPVLITLFREGQGFELTSFLEYLQGGIFKRVFVVPMETGLWHVHLAQVNGFAGVAGIPKLAELMAVEPISLSNIIFLKYSPYKMASGLANTSFVFAYYSIYGIVSLVFSLTGTWALDLSLLVVEKLRSSALRLATVAALVTSSIWFVSTIFTTALITNGFVLILVVAVILDRLTFFKIVSPHRKQPHNVTAP